ncbi:MAG: hypothetical protein Q8P99_01020 [bacterium]|nr:hypothetical protein [bacterium]MDZ4231367.1 hypothetical protein [Patescibacteria group bacterium]
MASNKGKNKPGLDRWFVVASAVLAGTMIAITAYAIILLSNNLFKAFVPRNATDAGAKFNLEGYSRVIEDLGRTPSVQTSIPTE